MSPDNLLISLIKQIPTIQAKYKYENEKSINPAYCDIEHSFPLCPYEKKIWVLRGDLILAVGIKNAYVDKGNTNIVDLIDTSLHKYLDLDDRYGHPSLAIPEQDYDGSAYYAGWLYQHLNHIEVFLFTGRYQNKKITALQQHYLERYISIQFMEAYGEQEIIFFDWENKDEIDLFLQGTSFPSEKSRRTYSRESLKNKNLLDLVIEHDNDQSAIQRFEAGATVSPAINGKEHMIHILARKGLLNHVQTLIERDPDLIHVRDGNNQTPLLWAASRGHHEVVALLISQDADVNIATQHTEDPKNADRHHNYSLLDWAIECGHTATILTLVNAGAQANYTHEKIIDKSLHEAIKDGDLSDVQLFIRCNKAILNKSDECGYTPLHYAAHYEQIEIARYLLAEGADVNAASFKHEDMVYSNMTTMDIVLNKQSQDDLVLLLLEAGANVPPAVHGQHHVIHVVAKHGLLEHVQALIERDPELIHVRDHYNQTPLLWAASRGHHEVVAFLIYQGADVNIATQHTEDHKNSSRHHNYSPLDWAIEGGHTATISILQEAIENQTRNLSISDNTGSSSIIDSVVNPLSDGATELDRTNTSKMDFGQAIKSINMPLTPRVYAYGVGSIVSAMSLVAFFKGNVKKDIFALSIGRSISPVVFLGSTLIFNSLFASKSTAKTPNLDLSCKPVCKNDLALGCDFP